MADQNTTPAPTGEAGEIVERLELQQACGVFGVPDGHAWVSYRDAAALITAQAAEVERLRGALEPFANLGVTSGPDDEPCSIPYRITRGSIRKARQALSALSPKEPEHG